MKIREIPQTTVRRCAWPINIGNDGKKVVLCIHGFTGYPGEMAYPAKRLAEAGWDVRTPRLTGHGTCGEDFRLAGIEDWRRQITDVLLDLQSRYDTIALLGHSMGGLLALDLARRYPVHATAVMAPAIGVRFQGQRFFKVLARLVERKRTPWKKDPEYVFFDERDEDDDEFLGSEYWCWAWIRKLASLLDLQNSVEKDLSSITSPVLCITAEKDTVVGSGCIKILDSGLTTGFEHKELKGCRHYIPYDPNPGSKEEAMEAVVGWLESL